MGTNNGLHVVLGASGGTGSALVRELVARGRRVRAVNRSGGIDAPMGVEVVAGDAADPESMRLVCRGAAVIYNCVNPPFADWAALFPRIMGATIAGAAAAGATLVLADDTWMYGRPVGPLTEDHPQQPVGRKGALRARLAATLLDAHRRGDVRTTIGRAPELYGPRVESLLGPNLFGAALRGGTARWIGDLDVPQTPLFIDDFARGLITLGERAEALGAVWHIPTAPPITGRAFVHLLFEALGRPPRVRAIGRTAIRALGLVSPLAREGAELVYQFEAPYIVDGGRFQRAFGGRPPRTARGSGARSSGTAARPRRAPRHRHGATCCARVGPPVPEGRVGRPSTRAGHLPRAPSPYRARRATAPLYPGRPSRRRQRAGRLSRGPRQAVGPPQS